MKICAVICEYNPFHNGHAYQLEQARLQSGADALLCIMSGNFVQRGEAAIMDKFTRAKHAVLAGADAVVELPTPFACANAELFAKGAIHLLRSVPDVKTLCFGAEKADTAAFLSVAALLNEEPESVSLRIKELTASGVGYAKARATAWEGRISQAFLSAPNNILGLEYTRAIFATNAPMEILPIPRVGGGYNEENLGEGYASATAIRSAHANGTDFSDKLPDFVLADFPKQTKNCLELLEKYAVLEKTTEEIARVCDCTEGLENAFKNTVNAGLPLVETLTSARYTAARIRRIALQNLLGIEERLIRESLRSPLYLRVLAVKNERKEVLSALSQASMPLLLRAHDEETLCGIAAECYERDIFAEKVHGLLYDRPKKRNIFV